MSHSNLKWIYWNPLPSSIWRKPKMVSDAILQSRSLRFLRRAPIFFHYWSGSFLMLHTVKGPFSFLMPIFSDVHFGLADAAVVTNVLLTFNRPIWIFISNNHIRSYSIYSIRKCFQFAVMFLLYCGLNLNSQYEKRKYFKSLKKINEDIWLGKKYILT